MSKDMAKSKTAKVVPSKSKALPYNPEDIYLQHGKGSLTRGGGQGGFYWHIYTNNKRVGYIFINLIKDQIIGEHHSIQIHINQSERGKCIGRIAYRLACDNSGYDKIYAHMRKSNIASKKAAEKAGFVEFKDRAISQLVMVWERNKVI